MFNFKRLNTIDLNLFLAFYAVAETGNITRAAQRLGISQPALSHALKRLRTHFGDSLFVKTPKGMVPTPFAKSLVPKIQEVLEALDSGLFSREVFESGKLKRTFVVRTTDLIEGLLLPKLMKKLEEVAPEVRLIVKPTSTELPKEELESGATDLAIAGFYAELPNGFFQQKVFEDAFLSAVRKDHPKLKGKKIDLEGYCAIPHLLISPGGDLHGTVDQALKKEKRQRKVVAGISNFMVSGWILLESEAVLTAPSRVVKKFEAYLPLQSFPPPLSLSPIKIMQVWHERNQTDAPHRWMRELIRSILESG